MYAAGPGHPFSGENPSFIVNPRFRMDGNWLAVTGACMMVARSKFFEAGCFDEELAVAYNDVALCLELRRKGYYNVLAHDAVLVHHESKSRGLDEKDPERRMRQLRELDLLFAKFPEYRGRDPFYSPNLAQDRSDFSIRNN